MNKRKLLTKDRYADQITLEHIIELRRQIDEITRQRDNALNMCVELARQKKQLNDKVWSLTDQEKRENP
jgi:hypothetical protein